jgi:predicted ABC-type ATPase
VDPNIILLAGPNGAGRSTAAPDLLHGALHVDEFENADVIARGLSAFNPEGAALDAGRVMLARFKELARQRKNIAFESTLASRTFAPWIRELKKEGYRFHLFYFWLPSPEACENRWAATLYRKRRFIDAITPAYAISSSCTRLSPTDGNSRITRKNPGP